MERRLSWIAFAALALPGLALPGLAQAQDQLRTLDAVREACEEARTQTRPRLYVLEVEHRFGDDGDDRIFVETQRNLRALEGRVSVLISGMEGISFEASAEDAARLRALTGTRLRIGFFLGFDDPVRQPCLVRGAHAVTIVRADLAFAELVSSDDERLARSESDRLRAWLDDQSALAIPGEGPRGAVGTASFDNAQAPPDPWQRALQAAPVRARVGQCHAEGVSRGAVAEAQVVVRLNVEPRTGRIRRADVAISSLGDAAEGECIARALGAGVQLPAGPSGWPEAVDLSVPVRLTTE